MLFELGMILLLVAINGLFAAAEIAIVGVERLRLRKLVEEKRRGALVLEALRAEPERFLATVQIAISRAFAYLSSFAHRTARHVAEGGFLVAMKGVHPDEELRELPPAFEVRDAIPLRVPGVDAARHLIVMQRR